MKDFTLITGACGGLGRAFVGECLKRGENLVLTGTDGARLEALAQDLAEKRGECEVKTFVLNLADEAQRAGLMKFLEDEEICVNKLINNAGVIIEGDLERFSDEQISNAIQVNCVGTLDLTKKLLRRRDEARRFEILTVASVAGFYPIPHMAVYAATKAFLVSMMTALSVEYEGKNVVFCTLCPGGIPTNEQMKASIQSMGLGGKLSSKSPEKVACAGLKAIKKGRVLVSVGGANKLLCVLSKLLPRKFLARQSGKIYKKSQQKRKF